MIRIAVASGKGGTGKTTLAVNLARVFGGGVTLLDCDVEEPNTHIFLTASNLRLEEVTLLVPEVDAEKCTACGLCGRFCAYHAIVSLKTRPLVFPEMCHGCGGCARVCPEGAISEVPYRIGELRTGQVGSIDLRQGVVDVGGALVPPVIRALKRVPTSLPVVILDAPPGTSCPVVTTVRDADFVVLVTEPTAFGLRDLSLAVEMIRTLGVPFGVVINRSTTGDDRVVSYCTKEGIPLLASIPDDRRVAEAYSRGELVVESLPEYRGIFEALRDDLLERIGLVQQRGEEAR